jgi:sporulation protein YlmC with PRC-barrel domain
MKQRTSIQLRILTPALAAAILATPVFAQPPETLEHQQRDQYLQERQRLDPQPPGENEDFGVQTDDRSRQLSNPDPNQNWQTDPAQETDLKAQDSRLKSAQDQEWQKSDVWSRSDAHSKSVKQHATLGHVDRASDLIGYDIRNAANKEIGEIKDLLVDLKTGQVALAIIEVGGVGPFGAEYYGVPPSALQTGIDARSYRMDENMLKATPKLDLSTLRQTDHATLNRIYDAHGATYHSDSFVDSVMASTLDGTRTADAVLRERQDDSFRTTGDTSDRQLVRGAIDQPDQAPSPRAQDNLADQPASDETRDVGQGHDNWGPPAGGVVRSSPDSRSTQPGTDFSSVSTSDASTLGLVRASDIIGADVTDALGNDLGEVKDLAVDLQNGRVVSAIISSGGFLGFGANRSVVPPMALQQGAGSSDLQLKGNKAQLDNAPKISGRDWPFQDQTYISDSYRVFGVTPYFESAPGGGSDSSFQEGSREGQTRDFDPNRGSQNAQDPNL